MANRLITWALGVRVGDPIAKALLVRLADGAREDGSHWPSHKTLSHDTEIPRRTLQRKLKKLTDLGLIRVEERTRKQFGGRTSNKYWLLAPPEFLRAADDDDAERCATVAQRAAPKLGAAPAPMVAQHNEPSTDPEESDDSSGARSELEAQVDDLTDLWPAKAEIIRAKVREALDDAVWADGPYPRIRAAAVAYLRETRGEPKAWLHKWLGHGEERHRDRAYLAWLPKTVPGQGLKAPARFPDETIRAALVAEVVDGEARARSYLDHAAWSPASRTITPAGPTARDRLREHAPLWARLGVTVGEPHASRTARAAA